jgi:tyrosine decarboxylase
MSEIDVNALFLGPQSENRRFFKEMLEFLIDEHIHWRRNFHPDDPPLTTAAEQHRPAFRDTLYQTEQALLELSAKLKASSEPWFSPRYLGHMNSDVLMAAALGYMATILYNPNNCAYEGSPATTPMELEVGMQLATMLGYDPERAWGHISADGTIANYEAVWFMRNVKSIPLAAREVKPDLVEGKDDWQLLNMPVRNVLELVTRMIGIETETGTVLDEVRALSVRGTGVLGGQLGKLLVPCSRHYSWPKAADILGIGQDSLVDIDVDENFRMNIDRLRSTIEELVAAETPILGVISVVGTTEEGAIDEVHRVAELRHELEKHGIGFYYHIDAAYGGYARTIFLDESGKFMGLDTLRTTLHEHGAIGKDCDWPSRDIYEAYKALPEADSITIDPHKMGYIPYPAGALAMKDKRLRDLVSYFAAYVFAQDLNATTPGLLGAYILEGSKAGASAAAVWAAHRTVPLNATGYGRIIGRGVEAASRFERSLCEQGTIDVDCADGSKRSYRVVPLTVPDFNIVCWAFNREGNTDLKAMNQLNLSMFNKFQYVDGPVYYDDFLTSHTELTFEDYRNAPLGFLEKLGIPPGEYEKEGVWVMRACVLTPFLHARGAYEDYWARFLETVEKALAEVEGEA